MIRLNRLDGCRALLTPVAAVGGILFLMMLFLAKPGTDESGETIRPKITGGFVFALFGFMMVLVGMVGSAIEPIADLELAGTVFGEAFACFLIANQQANLFQNFKRRLMYVADIIVSQEGKEVHCGLIQSCSLNANFRQAHSLRQTINAATIYK